MKVIAISGSARQDGNTALLIRTAFEPLADAGIETELVQLAGQPLRGCLACMKCWEKQDRCCVIESDCVNQVLDAMTRAEGVILGSPTYFSDVSAEMKAFIDRTGMVARANGNLLRRKAGAGIVAVRRGGSMHALQTLQNYFLINEMVIPGSNYWNVAFGRNIGEVADDEEGIATMRRLGENMAWLLEKIT
jgi:multimeric flavodoxin WrbA